MRTGLSPTESGAPAARTRDERTPAFASALEIDPRAARVAGPRGHVELVRVTVVVLADRRPRERDAVVAVRVFQQCACTRKKSGALSAAQTAGEALGQVPRRARERRREHGPCARARPRNVVVRVRLKVTKPPPVSWVEQRSSSGSS